MLLHYPSLHEHYKAHLRRAASLPSRRSRHVRLLLALDTGMVLVTLLYMLILALSQVSPPIDSAQLLRESLRLPLAIVYTVELGVRMALEGVLPAGEPVGAAPGEGGGAPRSLERALLAAGGWAPDLVIVAVGWMECTLVFPALQRSALSRLGGLRLTRILPLLGRVPWLRVRPLLLTVAGSLKGLCEVLSLLFLSLFSFALVAVQLWRGLLQGACTVDSGVGPSLPSDLWSSDFLNPTPCALNSTQYPGVPLGSVQAFGDACAPLFVPAHGGFQPTTCTAALPRSAGFDNISSSILLAFTASNTEGWSGVMYNLWHTWGLRSAVFFLYLAHIILSAQMLLELALAVLSNQYSKAVNLDEEFIAQLVTVCGRRDRERAASLHAPGTSVYELLYRTDSLVDSAPTHITQGMGLFARRRRLSSVVDAEVFSAALADVARDLAGDAPCSSVTVNPLHAAASTVNPLHAAASAATATAATFPAAASGGASVAGGSGEAQRLPWGGGRPPPISGLPLAQAAPPPPAPAPPSPQWLPYVEYAGGLLVVGYVWILGLEYYGMSGPEAATFNSLNVVFIAVFAGEGALKAFALGWRAYLFAAQTSHELSCVVLSVIGLLTQRNFGVVLLSRLFIVFKLMHWDEAWSTMQRMFIALPLAAGALCLFVVLLLGGAIVGRELFADFYSESVFPNYSTIQAGVLATFNCIDTENIDSLIFSHMDSLGGYAALFFIGIFVAGNLVVLNLLTAILIDQVHKEDVASHEHARAPLADAQPPVSASANPPEAQPATAAALTKAAVSFLTDSSNSATSALLVLRPPDNADAASAMRIRVKPHTSSVESGAEVQAAAPGLWDSLFRTRLWAYLHRPPGVAHDALRKFQRPDAVLAAFLGAFRDSMQGKTAGVAGVLRPRSLFCLHDGAALRRAAGTLVQTSFWLYFSTTVLLLSCLNLVLEEPRLDYCGSALSVEYGGDSFFCQGPWKAYLSISDYIISLVFLLELILQVIDKGLVLHSGSFLTARAFGDGPGAPRKAQPGTCASWWAWLSAYRPEVWGWLDLLVVLVSMATISGAFKRQIRFIRAARALRVFKLMYRVRPLRLVLESLMHALPYTRVPVAVTLVFVVVFAVLGLQYLQGRAQFCSMDGYPTASVGFAPFTNQSSCGGFAPVQGDFCALLPSMAAELACRRGAINATVPLKWVSYPENFDNFGSALLTAFELMTGENWPMLTRVFMQATVPLGTPYEVTPSSGSSTAVVLFFVASQLILKHFCKSLFVASLVENYFQGRQKATGLYLLTDSQKLWVANMQRVLSVRSQVELRFVPMPPGLLRTVLDPPRRLAYNVVHHPYFEVFTLVLVALNLASMASVATGQSAAAVARLAQVDSAFTLAFLGELVLKNAGLGLWQYWSSSWNFMDGVVSIGSVLALLVTSGSTTGTMVSMFLRTVRILRVVRIARSFAGLRRLISTMLRALPSVANVLAMQILIIFVFTVVGMSLFSGVRFGWLGYMTPQDVNFDSFVTAYMVLFRCSTGENFNGIMQELRVAPPFCTPGLNCSPSSLSSIIFFVLYFFTTNFVLLQLLGAVMLDAFDSGHDSGVDERAVSHAVPSAEGEPGGAGAASRFTPLVATQAMVEDFRRVWNMEDLDPDGRHFLSKAALVQLVCRVKAPMGIRGSRFEADLPADMRMTPAPLSLDRATATGGGDFPCWPASLPMRIHARHLVESLPLAPMRLAHAAPSASADPAGAALPLGAAPPDAASSATPSKPPSKASPSKASPSKGTSKQHTDEYHFHPVLYALVTRANTATTSDIVTNLVDLEGEHTTEHLPTKTESVISRAMLRWRWRRMERRVLERSPSPQTAASSGAASASAAAPLPAPVSPQLPDQPEQPAGRASALPSAALTGGAAPGAAVPSAAALPPPPSKAAALRQQLYALRGERGHMDLETLGVAHQLAVALLEEGGVARSAEAEGLLRDVLHAYRGALGSAHPQTLDAVAALGSALTSPQGAARAQPPSPRLVEGERLLQEAAAGLQASLPRGHPKTLRAQQTLGVFLHGQARLGEAEAALRSAIGQSWDLSAAVTFTAAAALGKLLLDLAHQARAPAARGEVAGRLGEAERLLRFALAGLQGLQGRDSQACQLAMVALGQTLEVQGKREEAQSIYSELEEALRAASQGQAAP